MQRELYRIIPNVELGFVARFSAMLMLCAGVHRNRNEFLFY